MVLRASSSAKTIPKTFLRQKRKWPNSPLKTQWHYNFNQQQALQTLIKNSKFTHFPSTDHQTNKNPSQSQPYILNCLINSFKSYDCDPTPSGYSFVIKTLIRKSQFSELTFVLSHLQDKESFETPERVFVYLIKVYGEKGMILDAIELFFRIPKFRCVPTVLSFNTLLLVLCRSREYIRFVPEFISKTAVMNIRLEESSFSILINALCRIGRVDYAVKMLDIMIDDGFSLNDKLCSLILSSLCRNEGVSRFEVMGVFEKMKKVGFCPGRADFYNVIRVLVSRGEGRGAFDALCEMKREGIKPDIGCYAAVLHGLVEDEEFSRVEEVFDELLLFGLVPDVCTYNAYINGLCKQRKFDDACKMVGYMEGLGCLPDLVTYRTVLGALCEVEGVGRARELWREMKKKGIELDWETYRKMIDVLLAGGEVNDARFLLEEMQSNRCCPTSSALDNMICSLCHGRLVSEAIHTLERVSAYDVVPGPRTWKSLLSGLKLEFAYEAVVLSDLVKKHEEQYSASE